MSTYDALYPDEIIPGERNKQAYTQNALFQLKNLILWQIKH